MYLIITPRPILLPIHMTCIPERMFNISSTATTISMKCRCVELGQAHVIALKIFHMCKKVEGVLDTYRIYLVRRCTSISRCT